MDADIAVDAGASGARPASGWRRVAVPLLLVVVLSHAADSRTVARLDASVRVADRGRIARRGFGGPRLGAGHAAAGPAARPLRRQDVRQRTVLRRQGAAHHLHPVSGAQLGGAARAQLPSRHRRPGSGHDRRQRVSRRRRPLPRQLVVPHGAERLQAFAEPLAGRRARRPGRRRLQHAQPVERQRRSHLRADHPLLGDRASVRGRPEGQLRPRRDQRRELGHLRQRPAVQQGLRARVVRYRQGRPLEGARQPARPRRAGVPRRRRRGVSQPLRAEVEGVGQGLDGSRSACAGC